MYSVRQAIIPHSNDSIILSIDFKNIEYALLAHFSNEPKLVELFNSNGDFHSFVAQKLFNTMDKEKRYIAKQFNFSQLYGASSKSISKKLKIPINTVNMFFERYRKEFPRVADFKEKVVIYASLHHGIRNPFGRWREIPKGFEYIAVNTLIQSTAADILKIAIIRVVKFLEKYKSKLLFPVHDELVINYFWSDGNIIPEIIRKMETFVIDKKAMFRIPIRTSLSICESNWGVKREVKDVSEVSRQKACT